MIIKYVISLKGIIFRQSVHLISSNSVQSLYFLPRHKMAASINGVLEETLEKRINTCKLLVVGAGGIGCELIKDLVLTGFRDIELVSKYARITKKLRCRFV